MSGMRVGSLRVLFRLERETLIAGDAGGGSISQWAETAVFWGRLDTLSQSYRATLDERLTHVVTARCPSSIAFSLGQRLESPDGRFFVIRLVREMDDRRRFVALYVEEVKYL